MSVNIFYVKYCQWVIPSPSPNIYANSTDLFKTVYRDCNSAPCLFIFLYPLATEPTKQFLLDPKKMKAKLFTIGEPSFYQNYLIYSQMNMQIQINWGDKKLSPYRLLFAI